jgi:hypothetical protein
MEVFVTANKNPGSNQGGNDSSFGSGQGGTNNQGGGSGQSGGSQDQGGGSGQSGGSQGGQSQGYGEDVNSNDANVEGWTPGQVGEVKNPDQDGRLKENRMEGKTLGTTEHSKEAPHSIQNEGDDQGGQFSGSGGSQSGGGDGGSSGSQSGGGNNQGGSNR